MCIYSRFKKYKNYISKSLNKKYYFYCYSLVFFFFFTDYLHKLYSKLSSEKFHFFQNIT